MTQVDEDLAAQLLHMSKIDVACQKIPENVCNSEDLDTD